MSLMMRVGLGMGAVLLGGAMTGACSSSVTETPGTGGGAATATTSTNGQGGSGGGGAVTCPADLPVATSNCDGAITCSYAKSACNGTNMTTATCVAFNEVWVWEVDAAECNGDPASCGDNDHPTLCAADTSCRWLVPGCGEPNEIDFEEGCYPAVDCNDDCDASETCTDVVNDPCHTFCEEGCASCGACGSQARICVAN